VGLVESAASVDRQVIQEELERARTMFHRLLAGATAADLRRRTEGTRSVSGTLLHIGSPTQNYIHPPCANCWRVCSRPRGSWPSGGITRIAAQAEARRSCRHGARPGQQSAVVEILYSSQLSPRIYC
jgi:hypothetical protein